jgi:RNA polymerase sigma factor (sigma-70 family)
LSTQVFDIHSELIERCRHNDRKAQYELYEKYKQAMYHVAFRICHDADEAEDVLQEAFVNAFTNIHQFAGKSPFGAWLKRIVVNKALSAIGKNKVFTEDIETMQVEVADDEPLEDLSYQVEEIKKAVKLLPDGFRYVLTLYLFEGYEHKEVAEILGISESTSKSQYNRAKKKLKEIILTNRKNERRA